MATDEQSTQKKRAKSELQTEFIPPNFDEIDYKVTINEKMDRLGINHTIAPTYTIEKCVSQFAKEHILPGSDLIQINDHWLLNNMDCFSENEIDDIFDSLKTKLPSFMHFRVQTIALQRGVSF